MTQNEAKQPQAASEAAGGGESLTPEKKKAKVEKEMEKEQETAVISEATKNLWSLASLTERHPSKSEVEDCLKIKDCDATHQENESGESIMMRAAGNGHKDMVECLLKVGRAPWNSIDRKGKCAGEYAIDNKHQDIVDLLVNFGVQAEMVLGLLENKKLERGVPQNEEYLKSDVEYTKDEQKLMEPSGDAVMMEWERPLMQMHAQILVTGGLEDTTDKSKEEASSSSSSSSSSSATASESQSSATKSKVPKRILNVGFGMGIFDTYVQDLGAEKHDIIEAHPQVYKKMIDQGWDKKPGVTIHFGRWQDVMEKLPDASFDGIFFDTFGEYYSDMKNFQSHLPRIMRPGGIYSFFNGLCPRNIFFHGVACQVVQLELASLGFSCDFVGCEIENNANADETWKGVRERYWWNDVYYLPIAIFQGKTK